MLTGLIDRGNTLVNIIRINKVRNVRKQKLWTAPTGKDIRKTTKKGIYKWVIESMTMCGAEA